MQPGCVGNLLHFFGRSTHIVIFQLVHVVGFHNQLGAVLCHAAQRGFQTIQIIYSCNSDKRAPCQAVSNIGFEQSFRHIHGLGEWFAHKMQRAAGGNAMRSAY